MSTIIAENFITPNGTSVVPVGTVIMYYGATAPTGYLECNGQSTTGYDDLEGLIGSNTPDLRGEFIRGWDNGRGVDTGRALGSSQGDLFKSHSHTLGYAAGNSAFTPTSTSAEKRSNTFPGPATSSTGGAETRPRNIALMYCIKH